MNRSVKRFFQPLEEWIYLKIYINPISGDHVISNYLQPLVDELYPDISTTWFFLRYRDTGYHIRLRFKITSNKRIFNSFKIVQKHLGKAIEDGYVISWAVDGYEREIERYGVENMLYSEEYFCINSEFITRSIEYVSGATYSTNCLALWMIHNTLKCFSTDLEKRLTFCKQNMESYLKEFDISDKSIKRMNDSCRRYRQFTDTLDTDKEFVSFPEALIENMIRYVNKNRKLTESIIEPHRNTINVASLIHLDVNRIYSNNARMIEMVLYYILYKKYISDKKRLENKH